MFSYHHKPTQPIKDKSGTRIGMLVAVKMLERDYVFNRHLYRFQCDCGETKDMSFWYAKLGKWECCGHSRPSGKWKLNDRSNTGITQTENIAL